MRQDNADERLTPIGHQLGIISDEQYERFQKKYEKQDAIVEYLHHHLTRFDKINTNLEEKGSSPLTQNVKLSQLLLRPQIGIEDLIAWDSALSSFLEKTEATSEQITNAETRIKYYNYIEKEEEMVKKFSQLDNIKIPDELDYQNMVCLSKEAREKLTKVKPANLGQASRISGVNPADIAALMIFLQQN